jgi:hypothetical protein
MCYEPYLLMTLGWMAYEVVPVGTWENLRFQCGLEL